MGKISDDLMPGAMRDRVLELESRVGRSHYHDLVEFHNKFRRDPLSLGFSPTSHELLDDFQQFRGKFLLEELMEYFDAVGLSLRWGSETGFHVVRSEGDFDPAKAFDALIDLVYVAIGTAHTHQFPWDEGWRRVHEANMKKVGAKSANESQRGHALDIVKPAGWKPPDLTDLLCVK